MSQINNDNHNDTNAKTKSKLDTLSKYVIDGFLWFIKDQWFLLGMVFVIIISSQVQVPESEQATKQIVVSYLSGMIYCPVVAVFDMS